MLDGHTATSVTLSWPESPDDATVRAYEVYRDGVRMYSGRQTSFVNRKVEPGKVYDYWVVAVGDAGARSAEIRVSVRTTKVDSRLSPPPELKA